MKKNLHHIIDCSSRTLLRKVMFSLRWTIILIGLGFTINGWNSTIKKYISKNTSFSATEIELDSFTYPSVTLCSGVVTSYELMKHILETLKGNGTGKALELEKILLARSNVLGDFLDMFMQTEDDGTGFIWLNGFVGTSQWTEFSPNLLAGNCYTYIPSKKSTPGESSGINLLLKTPSQFGNGDGNNSSSDYGAQELMDQNQLRIFLHDSNQFFYHEKEDMPSHAKIDNSKVIPGKTTRIDISYSKVTYVDDTARPCSSDANYSFTTCYEKAIARIRGCQKPWLYFPDLNLKQCDDYNESMRLYKDDSQALHGSFLDNRKVSVCPRSCTNSIYNLQYSSVKDAFSGDDMSYIILYFEDFHFRYEEEYLACDWTCLIGEVGGNFGFFLGGSIIALYDIVYIRFMKALK